MDRHTFTDEQVDAAIEYVIEHGATDRASTVSYSRVFSAASMPPPQELHNGGESSLVSSFMERFHYRALELRYPPLDALVVHTAGPRRGEPGVGYYRVNGHVDPHAPSASIESTAAALRLWREQRGECETWGTAVRRGHMRRG